MYNYVALVLIVLCIYVALVLIALCIYVALALAAIVDVFTASLAAVKSDTFLLALKYKRKYIFLAQDLP